MFTGWLAGLADENVLSLAFQTHWRKLVLSVNFFMSRFVFQYASLEAIHFHGDASE